MSARAGLTGAVLAILLGAAIAMQALRERLDARVPPSEAASFLYVRSPDVAARLALSYESLLADVYWMRALQHFGRTRLGLDGERRYDLLYPLLDLTTSLDPMFNVAYRFGAIFLTEPPPGGPGRPDEAIALLRKGLDAQPGRWEFAQDIGFVHYQAGDYLAAADWFGRAAAIPEAPDWLRPLEAVTRTQGGSRETSRQIWHQLLDTADEWQRTHAAFRLQQLDALDQIDALESAVARYEAQRGGALPSSWADLMANGALAGLPLDPAGHPYQLNPNWGRVTLDPGSPLNPLPVLGEPSR
jgi:tetratricopeptide (TPR) repeat protein